jgi:PAS domain S-box-containing protein
MNDAKNTERPLRILHIEDSPLDAEIIRERLIDAGFSLRMDWVANKREFTTFLQRGGYDLILADYQLPAFDGTAALRMTKSFCPGVPFICVSGAIGEEKAVELLKQGATDYVLKDRLYRLPPAVQRALDEVMEYKARQLAEQTLREREEQYRTLFESIADAVFLIDQETGGLLDMNPAATLMYGFNREEFLRMIATNVSAEPEETARCISEPVPFIPLRYHRHKNGNVFPVELTASTFELRGKNTIIVTARDITERKRAEAEKAKLEAQNRQLQKTESLGRMAGAIAHHFNNQLQAVMGNLEMAIDDLPQGVNPIDNLVSAMHATRKAAEVSGLILTYLGQTSGKHEPIDLSEACRKSITLLQAAAPKGMILKTNFPSFGPVIHADAGQIQQVLTNLVTNAWEATDENKGAISLSVKTFSMTDIPVLNRFPIDWQARESVYACLEVVDTGCGITNKDIEKIFDPFFTTKFTGRGLGLSVVIGIVQAHGGGVTVESEPGGRSIFRVFLPVSNEEVPCRSDLPSMQGVLQTGGAEKFSKIEGGDTVLLVEDEEIVRNVARIMLTRLGYTVLEAKSGAEAVEIFKQHQNEICCVLSDLTMPFMDGWETLTALRKLSPDIPVILSSGYDEAQVIAGDHPERPNAFLGKPYQLKGLDEAIRRASYGSNWHG